MAGDAKRTRVIMQFDGKPEINWYLLRGPERLVIDLNEVRFGFSAESLAPRGMITHVRYGALGEGSSRIILSMSGPFEVEKIEVSKNSDGDGYRLIADVVSAPRDAFELALARQADSATAVQSTPKGDRVGKAGKDGVRPFTIVIDPGHGGIDGGAEGASGTVEKTVTLAFGLELRKRLEEAGRYKVLMTRDKDEFLRLDERVRIGRQNEADLFISIHADTINLKRIRGATVYTISEKASDAIAHALAERENLADAIAGVQLEDESEGVADILLDLVRKETQTFSVRFARSLVNELSSDVELIKNPHRSAGFRVLMAPDMPSVLVELGYLSNAKDEALLRDPEWRAKAAESIVSAISLFAEAHARAGG